jgi:hypothetical protein
MDLYQLIKSLMERVEALEKQRAIGRTTYDEQGSDPATPATDKAVLYFKSDSKLYYKRDDGTVKEVVTV